MDPKKKIVTSKFLLPASTGMMLVGYLLLNLGYSYSSGDIFSRYLITFLLFGGLTLFIISVIQASIVRQRNIDNGTEGADKPSENVWVRLGVIITITFVAILIWAAKMINSAWT